MPVIGIDPTPNPNALKITFDAPVAQKAQTFSTAEAAKANPIAAALFTVEGVASVFMTANFATVNRKPGFDWNDLAPKLEKALVDAKL